MELLFLLLIALLFLWLESSEEEREDAIIVDKITNDQTVIEEI